jgi:hypothetical protein
MPRKLRMQYTGAMYQARVSHTFSLRHLGAFFSSFGRRVTLLVQALPTVEKD